MAKTMIHKKLLALVLIPGLAITSLSALPLLAQEDREGIGISPTTQDFEGDPGQQLNGQITVINSGNKPVRYRIYASDFKVVNEEYDKDFEPSPEAESIIKWFNLPGEVKELAPDAQQQVDYSIIIPANAVSRGYYGVIFAETAPTEADGSGVLRLKRVGSLVYLGVKGGLAENSRVISFETAKWSKQSPIRAQLRVQNDGNVHTEAKGQVYLTNILGRNAGQADLEGTVLPATIRKFNVDLPANRFFGIYKVKANIDLNGKTTQLDSGWILVGTPLWLGVMLLAVLVWAGWLILRVRKHGKRRL